MPPGNLSTHAIDPFLECEISLARLELLESVVSESQEWRELASAQGAELRELRRRSRSLADKLNDIESTLPLVEPSGR